MTSRPRHSGGHQNSHRQRPDQRPLWDKIWKDSRGRVVIFQMPNRWLIGWAVCDFASLLVPTGTTERVAWWLGTIALAIWAYLEISQGINYLRRGVGLIVMLLILSSVFNVGL